VTLTHLVPGPRSPALTRTRSGDWATRAMCALPRSDGLDLAELTSEVEDTTVLGTYTVTTRRGTFRRDYDDDLAAARAMCSVCPVLVACRARALLDVDVAGVAAGLTERERAEWRVAHEVTVDQLRVAVLVPDRRGRLVLDLSTETRVTGQRREITGEELVAIARLTAAGWTAEDIADQLVTVRAAGDGGEEIQWTVQRVQWARETLAGRGHAGRRPA
jgi:hypothetical protein